MERVERVRRKNTKEIKIYKDRGISEKEGIMVRGKREKEKIQTLTYDNCHMQV